MEKKNNWFTCNRINISSWSSYFNILMIFQQIFWIFQSSDKNAYQNDWFCKAWVKIKIYFIFVLWYTFPFILTFFLMEVFIYGRLHILELIYLTSQAKRFMYWTYKQPVYPGVIPGRKLPIVVYINKLREQSSLGTWVFRPCTITMLIL